MAIPEVQKKSFSLEEMVLVYTLLGQADVGQELLFEAYEELKKIRGNHPNLQYQYLSLYRIGKIKEYLDYFPMYKMLFFHFKNEYMRFIKNIHHCYCAYYVRKEVDLTTTEISKKYYIHIWRLHHQIYIPSLKTAEKKKITIGVVKRYFDELEPRLQLYYLNYVDKI